ncbi:sugar isomerase domain-containing protein [Actinomadura logoneensis]|uniref:Sugar isomerase domain-containing protein n=1 Tax=Actinomadura logoneensis TaxID=2293572 RepID=A0A372JU19_9ACTN|nr:SIS domain-containing protein [Actinomadura logoneensis]RFU43507.1 sugar isomerase domain-containing protein [Actinomadura logoneensis]
MSDAYFDAVTELLRTVRDAERERIGAAAETTAEALAAGRRLFAFGSSHSALPVQDIVYRAGGLMLVNPLLAPGLGGVETRPATLGTELERLPGYASVLLENSRVRRGDVLIVVSVSGRNALPVELAELAVARGVTVMAVTSRAYGTRLAEVADIVLDNHVPVGDAVLSDPGVPEAFCAASGVVVTAMLQALTAAIIERLLARGLTPPVFRSVNLPGGTGHNARLLKANADRIFYL